MRFPFLLLFPFLTALGVAAGGAATPPAATAEHGTSGTARHQRADPRQRTADAAMLAAQIDALLADEPGVYGIVVVDQHGDLLYERNADLPFVAASLYKLPVMAAVYEAERAGLLALDEPIVTAEAGQTTVAAAVAAMITASSNQAALALIDRLGVAAVNRAAVDLGLRHTRLGVDSATLAAWPLPPATGPDPDPFALLGQAGTAAARSLAFVQAAAPAANGWPDVTTPRDTARFFRRLLDRDVVDRPASTAMLRLLAKQTIDDRFPALLPPGTKIAHKTGNLPGVVHDAGILFAPDGPVVLVALAQDVPDEARAAALLRRLARLVYDHRAEG